MNVLAPIADKLGKLIRLLSSDKDGEVLAAVHGIRRTLASEKLDLHALADGINSGDGKSSRVERDLAWNAGYAAGRAAEQHRRYEDPSWHAIACECQEHSYKLREHERGFVDDMVRRTVHGGEMTEKQQQWLRALWVKIRR